MAQAVARSAQTRAHDPTVLITGDTAKERLAEISASGFIALHKPVEADDLRRTLSAVLVGRRFLPSGFSSLGSS